MNTIQSAFAQPWAQHLGWTLLHFVWQGALVSILFAAVRGLLGRSLSANARYILACLALGAMVLAPVATFGILASLDPPSGALLAGSPSAAAGLSAAPESSWRLASASVWQRTLPWLVMAWLSGVVLFSVRLIGGWFRAARLGTVQSRQAPGPWQRTLDRLIGRMGVGIPVRLLVSSLVEVPTVVGWLRPVILVPVGALIGLPPEHVEALLAHELAHIWRRDYLVNLLQSVAEAVLFYHPAVWWVSNQIRTERELCCDDLAVAACGDVLTYARALAELESCRPAHRSAALAANGGSLINRIGRLLGQPQRASHTVPGVGAAWAIGILLLAGLGAVVVRGAQDSAAPKLRLRPASSEQTLDRAAIWTDTVKQGDMPLAVRGLGALTTKIAAELKIAESQIKDVRPGQAVSLVARWSALGTRGVSEVFTGRVWRISPGVTNGTFTIDVQVQGPLPQAAQPGVEVDGTIQIGTLSNVVYVGRPISGKADNEGTLFKLEPDGKQAVRVKVQFGKIAVNLIEIRSGLQPGDKVILSDTKTFDGFDRIDLK
jgi:beta-lactamase regulating signal transducer with metallopeptidase domain